MPYRFRSCCYSISLSSHPPRNRFNAQSPIFEYSTRPTRHVMIMVIYARQLQRGCRCNGMRFYSYRGGLHFQLTVISSIQQVHTHPRPARGQQPTLKSKNRHVTPHNPQNLDLPSRPQRRRRRRMGSTHSRIRIRCGSRRRRCWRCWRGEEREGGFGGGGEEGGCY